MRLPLALAALLSFGVVLANADQLAPTMRLHQCVETRISALASRLENMPDSGSSISYANGIDGISYDVVPAVQNSRIGDPVRVCLESVPKQCPRGDDRGKIYSAQNLRTGGRWRLANDEHECGGA